MFQHSLMNLGVETDIKDAVARMTDEFQHSLMNLGVETQHRYQDSNQAIQFQHSLMNLGVETKVWNDCRSIYNAFQHSLMNLGVETCHSPFLPCQPQTVSAFSDESWGGDHAPRCYSDVPRSCFSIL